MSKNTNIGSGERLISGVTGVALLSLGQRKKNSSLNLAGRIFGLEFIRRALTGRSFLYRQLGADTRRLKSFTQSSAGGMHQTRRSVTINRPRADLYRIWRNIPNLKRFMFHVRNIDVIDDSRSHWVFETPLGTTLEWTSEITEDIPNERISWQSTKDSQIDFNGTILFNDAPANRGTEVHGRLEYRLPAGDLGRAIAMLFGEDPDQQLRANLRRFKKIAETGEIITNEGQTSGRLAA